MLSRIAQSGGTIVNLREGTRRLALFVGVVGAIAGGFASYMELQTTLKQRANHIEFEQLVNSGAVKQAKADWFAQNVPVVQNDPNQQNDQKIVDAWAGFDLKRRTELFRKMTPEQKHTLRVALESRGWSVKQNSATSSDMAQNSQSDPIQEFIELPHDQQLSTLQKLSPEKQDKLLSKVKEYRGFTASGNNSASSEVGTDGIKTIHWTKDYGVESIEIGDGQTLYPTRAPSTWLYPLIALLPALGFFLPWGAVRAIGWAGGGFVAENPK